VAVVYTLASLLRPLYPQLVNTASYQVSLQTQTDNLVRDMVTAWRETRFALEDRTMAGPTASASLTELGIWQMYCVKIGYSLIWAMSLFPREFYPICIARMFHSSWVSPSGRRLLGSFFSWDTTEKLREDGSGTSDNGFSLRYNSL